VTHRYMISHLMTWPASLDSILEGDQVVAFALVTPARGAMLTPLTNMGLTDRAAVTITPVTSSVGAWRKLERIDRNPQVAVAYHTRTHGFAERPEYVLVQGGAAYSSLADQGEW